MHGTMLAAGAVFRAAGALAELGDPGKILIRVPQPRSRMSMGGMEFRVIRLHARYRRDLTEERTREKQRAEKLLEKRRSSCPRWSPTCTG
jgi:hypothetical protein